MIEVTASTLYSVWMEAKRVNCLPEVILGGWEWKNGRSGRRWRGLLSADFVIWVWNRKLKWLSENRPDPSRPDKFHVYTFDLSPLVIEQNIKPNNLGMTKIIITNKIIFNKRFKDLFDTFLSFLNLKNCFHKQYMWFFFLHRKSTQTNYDTTNGITRDSPSIKSPSHGSEYPR